MITITSNGKTQTATISLSKAWSLEGRDGDISCWPEYNPKNSSEKMASDWEEAFGADESPEQEKLTYDLEQQIREGVLERGYYYDDDGALVKEIVELKRDDFVKVEWHEFNRAPFGCDAEGFAPLTELEDSSDERYVEWPDDSDEPVARSGYTIVFELDDDGERTGSDWVIRSSFLVRECWPESALMDGFGYSSQGATATCIPCATFDDDTLLTSN